MKIVKSFMYIYANLKVLWDKYQHWIIGLLILLLCKKHLWDLQAYACPDADKVCSNCGRITWEQMGYIGDSFGSLNTFFSGLAFLAVFITLRLQIQELRLQKQQLKEQRDIFEEDKRLRLRWEEREKAYRLIDNVNHRLQAFILFHDRFRGFSVCKIKEVQEKLLAGKTSTGEYAFEILNLTIEACLLRLMNYKPGNKGEMLSIVTDLNNICNICSGIGAAHTRVCQFIDKQAAKLNQEDRLELFGYLFSSFSGVVNFVLSAELEGRAYNSYRCDYLCHNVGPFLPTALREMGYSDCVICAFLHALQGRYRQPQNMNILAEEVDAIMAEKVQTPTQN